jgi:hypothetical protein
MIFWRKAGLAVSILGLMFAATLPAAGAGTRFEDSGTFRQVVLGTGSGLVSIIYTPAKLLYATGATITGGLILAFTAGDGTETAARIVRRSVKGDWWVHPDVFTGHRELHFVGKE